MNQLRPWKSDKIGDKMSRNTTNWQGADGAVDRALAAFCSDEPVLIHDAADREGETDFVYPAGAVTPVAVARLRHDAGGLVCVALSHTVAVAFDLPFVQDIIDHPAATDHDLGYDERSSFSLTVNHRDTYTGITDADRAMTITTLAEAAAAPTDTDFAEVFRAPSRPPAESRCRASHGSVWPYGIGDCARCGRQRPTRGRCLRDAR